MYVVLNRAGGKRHRQAAVIKELHAFQADDLIIDHQLGQFLRSHWNAGFVFRDVQIQFHLGELAVLQQEDPFILRQNLQNRGGLCQKGNVHIEEGRPNEYANDNENH